MSTITFKGWLKSELRRMSPAGSLKLSNLAFAAQSDCPRIAGRLLAYAIEIGSVTRLLPLIADEELHAEYVNVLKLCKNKSLVELSASNIDQLPWSYRKLLTTWRSVRNRQSSRRKSTALRLRSSLELKTRKNIRTSQICRELGLNKGNVNAYFKYKDASKVSLETATKIMRYLEACSPILMA